MMIDSFLTIEKFELWVEQHKINHDNSYIDAVVYFMTENDYDEMDMKELIGENLLNKMKMEAIKTKVLKSNIKPIDFDKVF